MSRRISFKKLVIEICGVSGGPHRADEIGIDSFQADRAPDHTYKTQNLAALFVRERGLFMSPANRGRFFHDGRFPTLLDVVNHYNIYFKLGLSDGEKLDLVEYLKSLPEAEAKSSDPEKEHLPDWGSPADVEV
jgi:hypothetical protein